MRFCGLLLLVTCRFAMIVAGGGVSAWCCYSWARALRVHDCPVCVLGVDGGHLLINQCRVLHLSDGCASAACTVSAVRLVGGCCACTLLVSACVN